MWASKSLQRGHMVIMFCLKCTNKWIIQNVFRRVPTALFTKMSTWGIGYQARLWLNGQILSRRNWFKTLLFTTTKTDKTTVQSNSWWVGFTKKWSAAGEVSEHIRSNRPYRLNPVVLNWSWKAQLCLHLLSTHCSTERWCICFEYLLVEDRDSLPLYHSDGMMSALASQITSLTIVYSTVYSGADQRQYQSSASLAFVRGTPRWPVNSPHKGPVMREMFPCDDVIIHDHYHRYWGPSDKKNFEHHPPPE